MRDIKEYQSAISYSFIYQSNCLSIFKSNYLPIEKMVDISLKYAINLSVWSIYLFIYLFVYIFIYQFLYLSIYLFIYIYQSFYLYIIYIPTISISIFIYIYIHLSFYLKTHLYIYIDILLPVCLYRKDER